MKPDTPAEKQFLLLKPYLKLIPLWSSCDASTPRPMSANDALIAEGQDFLLPGMKNYAKFIDPLLVRKPYIQSCLRYLGIKQVPTSSLLVDYILPLPAMISDQRRQHYKPLIVAISQIHAAEKDWAPIEVCLSNSKIAGDKYRVLHKTSELFDHEEPVFRSAFSDQDEKFLHDDVKEFRPLWLKVGLRHRRYGYFNPTDYLQCIEALSRRLEIGSPSSSDVLAVLSPLITPGNSLYLFDDSNWLAISEGRVFSSRDDFGTEPAYRQKQMTFLATLKQLLALCEIVSYNHVAVCWSQIPFALHPPTNEVFSKLRGNGKPGLAMVWRHLGYLAATAQDLHQNHVQAFLSDLHSTYAYLQEHLENSTAYFSPNAGPIWLNIDSVDGNAASLDSVKSPSSWHKVKNLVLSSSCDAGPVKAVRPSLMRYEKLLRALGCHSIVYPTVTRTTLHHGHSVSTSLRKLRDEGKLLDVTYSTEGRLIKAHRVVLAAISDKCAVQFSGLWAVEDPIKYDEQDDPETYLSYHTLSTMINYAYEDEVNWSEMEVSDTDDAETRKAKLDLLLDLYKGADCWMIPALTSQVEDKILVAGKMFINIENVEEIRQQAEDLHAKEVEKMCVEFIAKNRATVERASSAGIW